MKPCNPGVETEVTSTVTGEAVSVRVTQTPDDPGGWWLNIFAESPDGWYFVRSIVVAAPFRRRSRIVARIVEPGALGWKAIVSPPAAATSATGAIRVALDSCPKEFATEKPFTSKGLSYDSDVVPAAVAVPPGARVRQISLIAGAALATLVVTFWRSATETEVGPTITVLPGDGYTFAPEDLDDAVIQTVTFAGDVASYVVSWVE